MRAGRVLEETTLSLKGRRVRRVIRKVDPWSVLKVSILFYLCIFVVVLVAGIVLWLVAAGLGVISNVENFIGDLFALTDFHFEADTRVRVSGDSAWIAGGWRTEVTGPDGQPVTRPGRGTFVLERRGGKWLAVHSHFSLLPSQSESAHGRLPGDAARR